MTRSLVGRLVTVVRIVSAYSKPELVEVAERAVELVHQAGATGLQLGQAVE